MKLGKIAALFVTAAAAAICGAALLAIDSGAIVVPKENEESYYRFYDGGSYREASTLDLYLSHYGELYSGNGNFYGPNTGSIELDASDGNPTLTATQLSILAGKSLSNVKIRVKDGGFSYTVYLKNDDVNFFTGNYTSSIIPKLYADTSTSGTLKLYTDNAGYTDGHPFIINLPGNLRGEGMFNSLLKAASVDMSDRLRLYTYVTDASTGQKKEKSLKVIYSRDALYDLDLKFGNGINTYFYTKYDKTVLHLYNETNLRNYLDTQLRTYMGYGYSQSGNYYIESAVEELYTKIMDDLYPRKSTGNSSVKEWDTYNTQYLTAEEIEAYIAAYLGKETGSTTTVSVAANSAVISSVSDQKIIEDAIYSVFGWDLTQNVVDALREEIVSVITGNLSGMNISADNYKTYLQYYLNDWATSSARLIKDKTDSAKTAAENTGLRYSSLPDFIRALDSLRTALATGSSGRTYTLSQVADMVAYNPGLLTSGTVSTTQPTTTTQTPSTTVYGSETYVNGLTYATKSELTNYINALNEEIKILQEQINELKKNSLTSTTSGSLDEWLRTTSYGTSDAFISAVAEAVSKKIGSGESAYDIAVRNGFKGSELAWLNSLVGESAYELAVENGFTGSEKAWLNSLAGKSAYDIAVENGFKGTEQAWLESLGSGDGTGEEKYVYVYGNKYNSASASYNEIDSSDPDEEIVIVPTTTSTEIPTVTSGTTAGVTASASTRNPSTGVAAGVLIPAAAIASIVLIKKDKRRRGRK